MDVKTNKATKRISDSYKVFLQQKKNKKAKDKEEIKMKDNNESRCKEVKTGCSSQRDGTKKNKKKKRSQQHPGLLERALVKWSRYPLGRERQDAWRQLIRPENLRAGAAVAAG